MRRERRERPASKPRPSTPARCATPTCGRRSRAGARERPRASCSPPSSSRAASRRARPGAHMLIAEDGATVGTIGGGAIEQRGARSRRARCCAGGGAAIVKQHLTQELGMCCGGEMTVFLEVVEPAPRLCAVRRRLHRQAARRDRRRLRLRGHGGRRARRVGDRRALPDLARASCQAPEDFAARRSRPTPRDYAVVVTHDHALDQRLVQELLRAAARVRRHDRQHPQAAEVRAAAARARVQRRARSRGCARRSASRSARARPRRSR